MRVADYIMFRIVKLGIKQVFFLPGGGAMHLNDALASNKQLEPVLCLHEQACGIAAEGAGKLLGGPSACLVTSGPGATNVLTATLAAWLDSTPVFFISGQVKTADLKTGTALRILGVQEVDIISMASPVTKKAITLLNPYDVAYVFDELEIAALSGRKGPVWLDVPLDVQAMEIEPSNLRRFTPPESNELQDLVLAAEKTLALLRHAKRPVIIVGSGIRGSGGVSEFREFVEVAGIPVLTTWLGMDLMEDDHPLYAGRPGSIAPRWANFSLQNADLILVIGARLDMAMTAYSHENFARGAVKIMVDIDFAEIKKMRMNIHVPVEADAREFLINLNSQLKKIPLLPSYATWIEQIGKWKKRYPLLNKEHITTDGPISLYYFTHELSSKLKEGDVIASGSAGFCAELFLLSLRLKKNQRCFHNRGTGSMGFGLPAAIGACLASERTRTICVEGDGGIQMNIQELATLASMDLPVKCFVINNSGYASIRAAQHNYFKRLIGADASSGLKLPDLSMLAKAYGVPYMRIESGQDLALQLEKAIGGNGPMLCEVIVLSEEARIPRVASRLGVNGNMISSPLEDLFPFLDREELISNMYIPLLEE